MRGTFERLDNPWSILGVIAVLSALHILVLCPWMDRWGAAPAEISMALPGDGTEPEATATSTRGIAVRASAAEVWRWVVQMGQDQAGFYSNDWLENLALSDIHNHDRIHDEWQTHEKGERILGAGGLVYGRDQFWPTRAYEEGKMLYLWGPIVVLPVDAGSSRLLVRTYSGPPSLLRRFSYDWMHFVMERGMLLGVRARAEGRPVVPPVPDALARTGWIAATAIVAVILFGRHRGRGWGLLPLSYAAAILTFTRDIWSAMAGFLWWGVIAAGFLLFGRAWWRRLALATALVVLTMTLSPQPHTAFGIAFLFGALGWIAQRLRAMRSRS
jgi:hypothetical protein